MIQYLKNVLVSASTKLTPYMAILTTNIALLPQYISDYWGQAEAAIPHLSAYHKAVTVISLAVTVWARVRRDVAQTKGG